MISTRLDDIIAFIGALCILAGVYMLLGLPAALILLGAGLVYIGARIDFKRKEEKNEAKQ